MTGQREPPDVLGKDNPFQDEPLMWVECMLLKETGTNEMLELREKILDLLISVKGRRDRTLVRQILEAKCYLALARLETAQGLHAEARKYLDQWDILSSSVDNDYFVQFAEIIRYGEWANGDFVIRSDFEPQRRGKARTPEELAKVFRTSKSTIARKLKTDQKERPSPVDKRKEVKKKRGPDLE